jgi:NADH-quinone oxidoreductase subunit M
VLFYFFWEALLIPITISIGIWGSSNKSYAAIKYFVYTFSSSVFLLFVFIYLNKQINVFSPENFDLKNLAIINFIDNFVFDHILEGALSKILDVKFLIFFGLFFAFAVKIPMWPLHSWLADAHSESSSGGSIVLAALMLKVGIYALLRFILPFIPFLLLEINFILIFISLIAIIYVGIIAITQTDFKRLVAYSSISHMGLITLALFSIPVSIFNSRGSTSCFRDSELIIQAAIFHMISHAFSSGGMFLGCGYLYNRMKVRNISSFQGIAAVMPIFSTFFMLFALSNIGFPGTSGFVGEFLIIISIFKYSPLLSFLAGLTIIIAPAYTLWLYRRIFFTTTSISVLKSIKETDFLETFLMVIFSLFILFLGLYPSIIFRFSSTASAYLINIITTIG